MSDFDRAHFDIEQSNPFIAIKPASAARSSRPASALSAWLHAWHRRREFKWLATRLLTYDDHMLDDMGYAREDLLAAIELPLRMDAKRLLAGWRARRVKAKDNR